MKYIGWDNQLVMKKLNWILGVALIAGLTLYSNCGSDESPPPPEDTPQDIAKANLSKSWGLGATGSVKRDAQDVTIDFSSFTISFTEGGSYTSSGGGDVWIDGTGSWNFSSTNTEDASSIAVGSDDIEINVSSSSLLMTFSIPDEGSGIGSRISGIGGEWEFSLQSN